MYWQDSTVTTTATTERMARRASGAPTSHVRLRPGLDLEVSADARRATFHWFGLLAGRRAVIHAVCGARWGVR